MNLLRWHHRPSTHTHFHPNSCTFEFLQYTFYFYLYTFTHFNFTVRLSVLSAHLQTTTQYFILYFCIKSPSKRTNFTPEEELNGQNIVCTFISFFMINVFGKMLIKSTQNTVYKEERWNVYYESTDQLLLCGITLCHIITQ